MNLIGPAPFAGAENYGLLYPFDPGSSAHPLSYPLIGFSVDLVIAFY